MNNARWHQNPKASGKTCQSLKSHGMQLQAPAILTAAEPRLCHAGVRDPRALLWFLLIDVHSLRSASTCLDVSLNGEHVTPLHFGSDIQFHMCSLFICNSCKPFIVVNPNITGIQGWDFLRQADISPRMWWSVLIMPLWIIRCWMKSKYCWMQTHTHT